MWCIWCLNTDGVELRLHSSEGFLTCCITKYMKNCTVIMTKFCCLATDCTETYHRSTFITDFILILFSFYPAPIHSFASLSLPFLSLKMRFIRFRFLAPDVSNPTDLQNKMSQHEFKYNFPISLDCPSVSSLYDLCTITNVAQEDSFLRSGFWSALLLCRAILHLHPQFVTGNSKKLQTSTL